MIDLGIEPFLISSALIGVVAQRMVRRICPYCSRPAEVSAEEREAYEQEIKEERSEFMVGAGCNFCAGTGYLGRTGIFEVLVVSDTIRRMIVKNLDSGEIRDQSHKEGTFSLWHDGMLKVKAGVTTPYEVLRNVFSIS
jgi:general secretion pathway protein E